MYSDGDFDPDSREDVERVLAAAGAEVVGTKVTEAMAHGPRAYYGSEVVGMTNWRLNWSNGTMELSFGTEAEGRRMAAHFIHLWERDVACGMARDLAVLHMEARRRWEERWVGRIRP